MFLTKGKLFTYSISPHVRNLNCWLSMWFHPFLQQLAPGNSAIQTDWIQSKANRTEVAFFFSQCNNYVNNTTLKENYSRKTSILILSLLWTLNSAQCISSPLFFQFSFCLGFFSCFIIGFALSLWVAHKPVPCTYASSHWSFSFDS